MKILIISDLHFKENNNWDDINPFTKEMVSRVQNRMLTNEEIAIVTLGDIIDKGGLGENSVKYFEAEKFYHQLQVDIPSATFYFVPGNHELEADHTILSFNRFIKRINPKHPSFDVSVNRIGLGGLNVLLVDSTLNCKHDSDGKIDVELLKQSLSKETKNLIFLHYPPYSSDGDDKGLANHESLKATNSNFIFFGHQHGYPQKWDFLNNDTDIHAVGGMFATGANRGYVLLDVMNGRIRYAYRYQIDAPRHKPIVLFPPKADVLSHTLTPHEPEENRNSKDIVRSIYPNKVAKEYDIYSMLHRKMHTIFSAIKESRFVAIYGEAGMGKSYEMVNVYHHYKNDPDYFPIFVKLGDHTDDFIKECIEYAKNNTIDRKTPILILDAYDEFANRTFNLKQEIITLMSSNFEIKIIISSRTYSPIGIDGFTEYSLAPFSRSEITYIAQHHGVTDPDHFIKRIDDYDLLAMAEVPFYLFDIIEIYQENNDLPRRNVLVDEMIRHRFICADKKAHVDENNSLMMQEAAVRQKLMELAFIMQVSQTDISNLKFTELFASNIINLLKLTGMIDKVPQSYKWKFQHNIWREFLVAKYVSELPLAQLLDIITYDKEHEHLRDSWKQAVGYVLSFRKYEDLKGWIIENAKDIVYHLEPGVLSRDDKNKLFEFIVTDSYQKNLPIYTLFPDGKRFCAFYQSQSTIEFCLSTLRSPYDNCALNSIVFLLGNFTEFYGLEEELITALISILNTETPEYITPKVGDAILTISPNLSIEIADKLFDIVKSNNSPNLIDVFCYLINQWEYTERYADFIFSEIDDFKKYHTEYHQTPEIYKSLSYFAEPCNVTKAFDWHYKHLGTHYGFDIDYSFILLLNTAEFLYKSGKYDMLSSINEIFIYASLHGNHDKVKEIIEFYDKCHIRAEVTKLLATYYSQTNHGVVAAVFNLIDSDIVRVLSEAFVQGEVHIRLMEMLFYRLRRDRYITRTINEAVTKVTGQPFEELEDIDWEEERIKNKQLIFDSYFNKNLFRQNVELLLEYYPPETKCSELLDDSPADEKIIENTLLRDTRLDLYCLSNYDDCAISTCTESPQWEIFCKHKIFDILSEDKSELEFTGLHIEYFKKYFNENIEIFSSPSTPISDPNNFIRAKHTITLIRQFKYECCDAILLDMLELSWHAFANTTYSSQSLALDFVCERISDKQLLRNRIIENLRNKSLTDDGINAHIIYCHKNSLPDAIQIATKVFQGKKFGSGSMLWDNATDYLIEIKGLEYVDSLITDSITDYQIEHLSRAKKRFSNDSKLISVMIKRNQESDNKTKYLIYLLCYNTEYGLKTYIDLCRENNTVPGYVPHSDSLSTYYQLTDAIRMIKDVCLIDHIQELIEIAYAEDFNDADSFGLRNALYEAIANMGYNDPQRVIDMLQTLLSLHPDNDGIKRICYRSINSIQNTINRSSDIPWDDDRISEFILQQRNLFRSCNPI